MNAEKLSDTLRLLRDVQAMDDVGLLMLVKRTTRYSRLGRAARAVERRRRDTAPVDVAALLGENFSLGA